MLAVTTGHDPRVEQARRQFLMRDAIWMASAPGVAELIQQNRELVASEPGQSRRHDGGSVQAAL